MRLQYVICLLELSNDYFFLIALIARLIILIAR